MKKKLFTIGLILAALIFLGDTWEKQTKAEPSDYLTFNRTVYTGDTLWTICEKYSGYEDLRDIIQRTIDDNEITDPGALQPGQQIKIRVRKVNH